MKAQHICAVIVSIFVFSTTYVKAFMALFVLCINAALYSIYLFLSIFRPFLRIYKLFCFLIRVLD